MANEQVKRQYMTSEKAVQQRQLNAYSRQFSNFVKALQDKLRLHLDEVARLQEVTIMIKHSLSFNQIAQLYADELHEHVQKEVIHACRELKADMQAKLETSQDLVKKLVEERNLRTKLVGSATPLKSGTGSP
jgi:uncharacterized membrane-anchored protein YjiN (DUF445 family)